MNQIKSIQLGVIAICIATVPLSLAQTPRTRTSGSNQTITTTTAAPIHAGSNGNSIRAPQIGVNAGIPTITGATPNIGAHTAINAGVQTGISNQGTGITRAVTGNSVSIGNSLGATQTGINAGSATNIGAHTAINAGAQTGVSNQATGMAGAAMGSGNSTGATQIGINAATANTKANTNAGAHTGTAAESTQPQVIIESTQLPTVSTPTPSPTPTPSATPMASLAPAPSASVSPTPTPL